MAERRILLVGQLSHNALEVLETVIEVGLKPIAVIFEGQKTLDAVETYRIEDLPRAMKKLPALVSGPQIYADLREQRIDQRWKNQLVRHVTEAEEHGISRWTTLVHPSAVVSPSASLGDGVFVGPLVSVSSQTEIGAHTRIGRNSTIGHHVIIGSFCHVGPGIVMPGQVKIEDGVTIGPGSVFLNHVRIGRDSLIGAGSVVTKSVKPGKQAQGNPARTLRSPKTVVKKTTRRLGKWVLKKLGLFEWARKRLRKS